MESRGPEGSKNVKTSQAYFFEGFISFFEDFSLTKMEMELVGPLLQNEWAVLDGIHIISQGFLHILC